MKVSFVTPRYGTEVLGGAEYAARMLAERLVSQLDWNVEALTSCALDASTWQDSYPPGDCEINGVNVRRFSVSQPRHPKFHETSAKVHGRPRLAPMSLQEQWVDEQGPTAPAMLEAIAASNADVFVFYPYLYYPTVRGLPLVADRSVLHPAAHDEPSLQMSIFSRVFSSASGLVFQTDGERRLSEDLFPIAHHRQLLLGLGVDHRPGDEAGFRRQFGLGERPYVLCLGRVDDGKGCAVAARYFQEYKRRNPGPLALVFAGTVVDPVPTDDDIFMTGPVSDDHKWGALNGSTVLLSASAYEAFSLALVEGWAAGKPALVNARCIATREHVERSKGGLWFDSYHSFAAALDRLTTTNPLATQMATAGKHYVDSRFRWPALIDRYGDFLLETADRSSNKLAKAG